MNNLPLSKRWSLIPQDPRFCKPLRIMKISTCLLFAFVTGVHAKSTAQKVTLNMRNARIEEALSAISKQSHLRVLYSENLNSKARISVNVKDASVEEALNAVLKNNNIEYKIIANTISVNSNSKNISLTVPLAIQQSVSGTVTDKDGKGLSGATVTVKGTSVSTQTDEQGRFKINAPLTSTLVVRYIGYVGTEISVGGRTSVTVILKPLDNQLDVVDVVATGYQNIDRKFFTGSATRVDAKDAERAGVPDVSRMLEGQVAGVSLQNVSGTFGAAPKIRVRGATSLSGDNKPLWVIDGIILEDVVNISNEQLSTGDMNTLLGSSVAGLNPDDIESFNILKDAAATAMYGARAMNGVIVVTTKKGKVSEGKPHVSYTGNFTSYIKPSYNNFDVMTSYDQMAVMIELKNKGYYQIPNASRGANGGVFYKMYNKLYEYDETTKTYGLRNDAPSQVDFLTRYANANTDWFDLLFKNSFVQEHSLSVSSGTEKTQNYSSVSYLKDPGMTIGNNVQRFTGNFRSNYKFNDKFSAEVLGNGSIRQQKTPGTVNQQSDPVYGSYYRGYDINPYNYALGTSRLITPYDENGDLEYFTRDYAPFNILNEVNNNYMELGMIDFKVQGALKYKIIPSLSYSVTGAYRFSKSENQTFLKENSNYVQSFRAMSDATIVGSNDKLYNNPAFPNDLPISVLPEGGFYKINNDNLKYYYFRQDLEFNKEFNGGHNVNVFANMEMITTDRQAEFFDGVGYSYENGGLAVPAYEYFKEAREEGKPYYGMGYNFTRFNGYSLRAAYAYKQKYSVNGTVRYDGSNKMGKSRTARWLPTWNVSGKWNVDEEKFWPKDLFLSNLSVRATYGMVANMGNATNSSAVFYNQIARRREIVDQETLTYISNIANKELTWEKMNEFNLGFDMGLFESKVGLTVDLYKRKSYDLLGSIQTSGIDGEYTKTANYADMDAKGIEVAITGTPVKSKDFRWKTNFNFAFNKNKITRLDINPNIWRAVSNTGGAVQGYSQRSLFSLQFDGLNPEYGYPTFIGTDGIKTTNVYLQSQILDYLKYEGPVEPTFTGGFFNAFSYKSFTLSGLLTFSAGNKLRLKPSIRSSYDDMSVMTKDMLNRWIMPGDELKTTIPALLDPISATNVVSASGTQVSAAYPYNAYNYSTERVVDGDYIKLKNISLGYALPKEFISRMSITNASINVVANNIWTIMADKRLHGQDPEFFATGGVALPVPKQVTISLKVGF